MPSVRRRAIEIESELNKPISGSSSDTNNQSEKTKMDGNIINYEIKLNQRKNKQDSDNDKGSDKPPIPVPLIDQTFPMVIVWRNVFIFIYLHLISLYGVFLLLTGQVMLKTFLSGLFFLFVGGFGTTAGAHRLWAHKSYKAKLPLRVLLAFAQTVAFQNSIHEWSRDHRIHHKYSETNADPHNAKRGFFFAHIGWLMTKKHPAIKEKGAGIDMSDLEADPIIMFQKKYYVPLVLTISFFIPTLIPMYFWGESFLAAWAFSCQLRYLAALHLTWLVNSLAHLEGERPYDKTINPAENKVVSRLALGEGWHNYHHVQIFPWDYKTAELGNYQLNWTTAFIDLMAKIGWAYDLKFVAKETVLLRMKRTGGHGSDNAPQHSHSDSEEYYKGSSGPWGWGDKDIPKDDTEATRILYPEVNQSRIGQGG